MVNIDFTTTKAPRTSGYNKITANGAGNNGTIEF
jgi:hypothetical protein